MQSQFLTVKNIIGTSDHECIRCGSWKRHYIRKGYEWPQQCVTVGCQNDATVGAHIKFVTSVKRDNNTNTIVNAYKDNKWYIIPICQSCNKRDKEFHIYIDTPKVSARKCYPSGKSKFRIGKHNGKTFSYVKRYDKPYCYWAMGLDSTSEICPDLLSFRQYLSHTKIFKNKKK